MISQKLFAKAQNFIPAGVNSPVRAFLGVGGTPIFIKSARGAYLESEDGQFYIDYVGSWGPMIAGHAHPRVIEAVNAAVEKGLSFGAPTEIEIELAEKICKSMPSIELIRMVNSGTEATMSAIRLARGFTQRNKIIKFAGCYHGHADSLLVQAGSGAMTFGVPSSAGVPRSVVEHTLIAQFNNLESVAHCLEKYPDDVACVILEPIAGNMNCILPEKNFLQGLRTLCDQYGVLLIFDEVMTGFRVAHGGAQALYQIKPDLTALGKIIGGGMPVGAFGGRADIMKSIAPLGSVYQAGTLSGNPVAMAAGLAMMDLLSQKDFYEKLNSYTTKLMNQLQACATEQNVSFKTVNVGSMFGMFFTDKEKISSYEDVKMCDVERFKKFFHGMLKEGVYFAPSAFEAGFVSAAHTEVELQKTLQAAEKVFSEVNEKV